MTTTYRPVWDVQRRLVSTYLTMLRHETTGGVVNSGYSSIAGLTNLKKIAEFDKHLIQVSIDTLSRNSEFDPVDYRLAIPILYNAFKMRSLSDKYSIYLSSIPENLRQRIYLQIIGIDPHSPSNQLKADLDYLRQFCRGLVVHFPLGTKQLPNFSGADIYGISTAIPPKSGDRGLTKRRFKQLAALAKPLNTNLYISGVSDLELLKEAT